MSGSVSPLYEPAVVLGRAGVIAGCDLTTEAALAKLSYLLALPGLTVPEVTRQMSVALVGEMTTPAEITFAHPGDGEPSRQANLARLRHAIAAGDLVKIDEIMKYEIDWLLNEADATGNTPMVRSARRAKAGRWVLTRTVAFGGRRAEPGDPASPAPQRGFGPSAKPGGAHAAVHRG
jgi:lysophospholipase